MLVACGGTHNFAGLLVARFFQGVGGCMTLSSIHTHKRILTNLTATFSTMVGGVISDIYHTEDRNTPMALFSGSALFGTGLAPLIAGVIVSHTSWRWVYYSHAIVSAVFVLIIFVFFKETRGSVLLSRKAKTLNNYYEALEKAGHYGVLLSDEEQSEEKSVRRIRWKVKSDEQRASLLTMIQISLYRPFRMSFFQPLYLLKARANHLPKTCSSQNLSSSSSRSGYPSAGPPSTCNSALSHSSSVQTTASTSSKQVPCSQVSPQPPSTPTRHNR